jgi:hypothetical protein
MPDGEYEKETTGPRSVAERGTEISINTVRNIRNVFIKSMIKQAPRGIYNHIPYATSEWKL